MPPCAHVGAVVWIGSAFQTTSSPSVGLKERMRAPSVSTTQLAQSVLSSIRSAATDRQTPASTADNSNFIKFIDAHIIPQSTPRLFRLAFLRQRRHMAELDKSARTQKSLVEPAGPGNGLVDVADVVGLDLKLALPHDALGNLRAILFEVKGADGLDGVVRLFEIGL